MSDYTKCTRAFLKQWVFVGSLLVLCWQLYDWLLFPAGIDFPYLTHLPLLFIAICVHCFFWSRQRKLVDLLRRSRKMIVITLVIALTLSGTLYTWAIWRVASYAPPTPCLVSDEFRYATISMEDGHFYEHHGLDWRALHRAIRANLRTGRFVQGGSTITQQLAKNLFLNNERTLTRKLYEALIAVVIERRFSKAEIFSQYVDVIDYGMGQKGIRKASAFYFRKSPEKLSLAESAILVGMVSYAPNKWPKTARIERGRVTALKRIAYWFPGRYSQQEFDAALNVPLHAILPGYPQTSKMGVSDE